MLTKNGQNVPIEELTKDNYLVPKGEENVYHCVIEVKQFDPKTGKRLSKPRVQKFGRKIFEKVVRAGLMKQGYDIVILHDPNEWIKAHRMELAQRSAEREKAVAERKQAEFDAAVQAAVEKALAAANKPAKPKGNKGANKKEKATETGENTPNTAE